MLSRQLTAVSLAALIAFAFTACDREGPAERAGEKVDRATERAGEQTERTLDRTGDAIEDSTDRR